MTVLTAPDLLAAVAADGLLGTTHGLPPAPLLDEEFEPLLEQCLSEKLTGALITAIGSGRLAATDLQGHRVSEAHFAAVCHCMELEAALLDVTRVLDEHDIETRVLKGSAAAHLDYADPSDRTFADIDLLVRSDDFDKAVALLLEEGFTRPVPEIRPGFDRRFGKGCTLNSPDGYELDLHRTFVTGPFGLTINLDDLWQLPAPFVLGGQHLMALSRELRLLHACYHAALGDRPPRIAPLRDIARLVLHDDLDEQVVRELAYSWRGDLVVAHAIRSTWETFALADDTALTAWARRYRPDPRQARAYRTYFAESANYAARSWASVRALPTTRQRATFLFALAFPQNGVIGGSALSLRQRMGRAGRGLRAGR
jgi:Uncharacterised nucleotidyltransferase